MIIFQIHCCTEVLDESLSVIAYVWTDNDVNLTTEEAYNCEKVTVLFYIKCPSRRQDANQNHKGSHYFSTGFDSVAMGPLTLLIA